MSAPKISAMDNEPRNLTIGTLIGVAHALDSRVEIKLVRRKGTKTGRRAKRGEVKTRSLSDRVGADGTEGCGTRLIGGPVGAGAGATVALVTGKKDIKLRRRLRSSLSLC
jgi:hypothetical protein